VTSKAGRLPGFPSSESISVKDVASLADEPEVARVAAAAMDAPAARTQPRLDGFVVAGVVEDLAVG